MGATPCSVTSLRKDHNMTGPEITPTDAREGENRRWQWRTFVVSTLAAAVLLFLIYFFVIAQR